MSFFSKSILIPRTPTFECRVSNALDFFFTVMCPKVSSSKISPRAGWTSQHTPTTTVLEDSCISALNVISL